MNNSDFLLLSKATGKIYRDSLAQAFNGVTKNWRMLVVHLGYAVLLTALLPIAQLFGGMAGGFLLGMVLAVIMGQYLVTIRAAVAGDQLRFSELKDTVFELFSPVISVLFTLFILDLLVRNLFGSAELAWLRAVVSLFVTVMLNPIPETIYTRPAGALEMFSNCLEFIKENFVEWFLPVFALALPVLVFSPDALMPLAILFFTTPPLDFIERLFLIGLGTLFSHFLLVLFSAFGLYFVLTFRGCLYKALATSTRRKRIYQQRNG